MKISFIFRTVCLACLMYACTKPAEQQQSDSGTDTLASLKPETLTILDKIYTLDSIPKEEFMKASRGLKIRVGNMELIDDTAHVVRDSLKLIFHLSTGVDSVLEDNDSDDPNIYANYKFLETLDKIDYWLLEGNYYEWHVYHIIDKSTGEKINLYGEPVFSPNGQYFVCWSEDMEAGFSPNGIQLFAVENKKAMLVWEKEIGEWGVADVRWKDDRTLYIEQSRAIDKSMQTYRMLKLL